MIASRKQAGAEVDAYKARLESAKQDLENAKRDLDNTVLNASYNGQIASVHVVPGSIVSAGSPIMTLQMMNPIKVEIEVSAEQSRDLQRRRQVQLSFPLDDGTIHRQHAMLHEIDSRADPATRTFSATFLIINKQRRPALPKSLANVAVARTEQVWPLNINDVVNGKTSDFMVEEGAIETSGDESFVWMLRNVRFAKALPPLLKVDRKKVILSDVRLPFLGNWIFRQVKFQDGSVTDQNLLVGALSFTDVDRDQWDGESVFLDLGMQWMLRPGDVVTIGLDPELTEPGFFVPVQAIYEDRGSTFVFVAKNGVAIKTPVRVIVPRHLDSGSSIPHRADR